MSQKPDSFDAIKPRVSGFPKMGIFPISSITAYFVIVVNWVATHSQFPFGIFTQVSVNR